MFYKCQADYLKKIPIVTAVTMGATLLKPGCLSADSLAPLIYDQAGAVLVIDSDTDSRLLFVAAVSLSVGDREQISLQK